MNPKRICSDTQMPNRSGMQILVHLLLLATVQFLQGQWLMFQNLSCWCTQYTAEPGGA